jgi:NADH-quinone oxidoreductase subunit K
VSVPAPYHLALSAVLFTLGMVGVLVRRSALVVFMSIELMLNAVNLALVTFARFRGTVDGQLVVFFVLVVAAVEVVIGLAIIVDIFRSQETVDIDQVDLLRG